MPSYSHWRLRAWGAGAYVQLAEVKLLDSGGADLSVGGTASASSEFSSGFLASAAFDKNDATEWATVANDPAPWVQYALAAPVDAARISIRSSASSSYIPNAFKLEASNSGSGPWVPLALAGIRPATATTIIYDILATQEFQEYRWADTAQLFIPPAFSPLSAWHMELYRVEKDLLHGGLGYIFGTTYLDGSPDVPVGNRRVRLHRDVDGLAIRETWSNPAGYYEFRDISMDYKYSVIAYDHTHDYRAVAADNLTPEVAP